MARLMSLTLAAFVCCVTLAVVTSTGMYPQPYMMQGIKGGYYGAPMVYPAYPAYGYGNQGFSPVGQGGIMEFFFMRELTYI